MTGPPPSATGFETLSWHDCHIWRIEFRTGDPAENAWTSRLALRIDYIVEWLCSADRTFTFRLAPALLVFHDVSAPRIAVDWATNGESAPIQDVVIDRIERELDESAGLAVPYYRWTIQMNWPAGGTITF